MRFSWARVLFTLSITCPIMVVLLSGYDYRVRMVPLAQAVILLAPLVGIPAYLALPRDPAQPTPYFDTITGVILIVVFHVVFILSYIGPHTLR